MSHFGARGLNSELDIVAKRKMNARIESSKATNIFGEIVETSRIPTTLSGQLLALKNITADWDSVRVSQVPPPSLYRPLGASQVDQDSAPRPSALTHPSARPTF